MSEKTQHTPGPWSVTERKPSHDCYGKEAIECLVHVGERTNMGNALAIVGLGGIGAISTLPDHVRANARLIAAAPDLYHPELAEWWTNGNVPVVPERIADLLDAYCAGVARAATGKGVEGE